MRILRASFPTLLLLGACGGSAPIVLTTGTAGGGGGAGAGGTTGIAGGTAGAGGSVATAGAGGSDSLSADAGSIDEDAGPDAQPAPIDATPSEGGVVIPPYASGIVDVINASNWNETAIYPFSKRRMLVRDEENPQLVLLDLGAAQTVVWKVPTSGPWARAIQLIGNDQVMGGRPDGYEVFDLKDGHVIKTVKTSSNITSAYRMANGETVLTSGVGATPNTPRGIKLSFLDTADKVSRTILYPGFGYSRMSRPTRNGTFLVPSDTTVFEGDANGKVLWTAHGTGWGHVWEPLLMADGDVLLSTFFGATLDVIDATTHMVTKRYGGKTMPEAAKFVPNGFAEYQILPNGNLITSNWQGHGGGNGSYGIQVIEFNPAGDVVWYYKQDPTVFSSIQGLQVIDGMNPRYLHALEISPDSTWQPVIPTP